MDNFDNFSNGTKISLVPKLAERTVANLVRNCFGISFGQSNPKIAGRIGVRLPLLISLHIQLMEDFA